MRSGRTWDLVVIGGGATGLGTALDAVTRGYQTLLLEAHDFSSGTSSRSTKLIHGGVRYLAQGQIGMVREALRERELLLRNARHLVDDLEFVIPAYSLWSKPYYGLGLKMYDLLARRLGRGRSRVVGRSEALKLAPTLRDEGLRGGIVYQDGQFDDARLAITLLLTILDHGGTALNYVRVESILKSSNRVVGVIARDTETGESFEVRARGVINATGVFCDELRLKDDPSASRLVRPSQGVHLVVDRSFLPGSAAVLIPKTEDGRVLFAIPWQNRVLIGTTDTPVQEISIEPRPLPEEVAYLIRHAGEALTKGPRPEDVLGVFVGLRPLIDDPSKATTARISREHLILVAPSGLITITGGKWTTYRQMAEEVVDRAAEVAGLTRAPCRTASIFLHGWHVKRLTIKFGAYGMDASALHDLVMKHPDWDRPLHPNLPAREVEVVWSARHELARTVADVLARRTRSLLLDARASLDAAPRVAELMAEELGFDAAWKQHQVEQYAELVRTVMEPLSK